MKLNEIVRVALKVTGLIMVVWGVVWASASLPIIIEALVNGAVGRPAISWIGGTAIPIVAGLFVWWFPGPVADRIVDAPLPGSCRDEWLAGLESVGIRILSVTLLFLAISDLVSGYAQYVSAKAAIGDSYGYAMDMNAKVGFWVDGLQIVMALALFLGSKGIASFARKLRYGGRHELTRNDPGESG